MHRWWLAYLGQFERLNWRDDGMSLPELLEHGTVVNWVAVAVLIGMTPFAFAVLLIGLLVGAW